MTFLLAWKFNGTAFMLADSAITYEIDEEVKLNMKKGPSSFGEISHQDDNILITEAGVKIHNIENKVLLGYAGSTYQVNLLLQEIKIHISNYVELDFISTINRIIQTADFSDLIFTIAFIANGEVKLFFFDSSKEHKLFETNGFCHPGAGRYFDVTNYYNQSLHIGLTDDDVLASITAFVTCMSVNYRLLEKGVGGFFTGAYLKDDEINWLKDIGYYLYSPSTEPDLVKIFTRNNMVYSRSNPSEVHIYHNTLLSGEYAIKIWQEIEPLSYSGIVDYFVFIGINKLRCIVLSKENNKGPYIENKMEGDKFLTLIRSDMLQYLDYLYNLKLNDEEQMLFFWFEGFRAAKV
jgi:hypothetical protein